MLVDLALAGTEEVLTEANGEVAQRDDDLAREIFAARELRKK